MAVGHNNGCANQNHHGYRAPLLLRYSFGERAPVRSVIPVQAFPSGRFQVVAFGAAAEWEPQ